MTSYKNNIDRMETVAAGLEKCLDGVIFIGGACTQFYVQNPDLWDFRPTRDIDCIIKIKTYAEFARFSEKLRECGFSHDSSENAPIVRWIYKGIVIDTIPDACEIAGFPESRWFAEGRLHAMIRRLPSGRDIKLLSLPYFLATKLEASEDRGGGDYLADHDIEDVIAIFDGNETFESVLMAPASVKIYLSQSVKKLLSNPDFTRSLSAHIGFESSAYERAKSVIKKLSSIS